MAGLKVRWILFIMIQSFISEPLHRKIISVRIIPVESIEDIYLLWISLKLISEMEGNIIEMMFEVLVHVLLFLVHCVDRSYRNLVV